MHIDLTKDIEEILDSLFILSSYTLSFCSKAVTTVVLWLGTRERERESEIAAELVGTVGDIKNPFANSNNPLQVFM